MNPILKTGVIVAVAAVLCAATLFLVPHLRRSGSDAGGIAPLSEEAEWDAEQVVSAPSRPKSSAGSRAGQVRGPRESDGDQEFEPEVAGMSQVEEMTRDFEEMLRKFHGTPEERQEVIDECEGGRELIQMIAELSESSIGKMSTEELEKERENFEKEYRAQLEFLRTGQLQSMLTTPDEQEIIGSTVDVVQDFLERMDAALESAGY